MGPGHEVGEDAGAAQLRPRGPDRPDGDRTARRVAVPAAGPRPGGGAAGAGAVLPGGGGLRRAVAAWPPLAAARGRGEPDPPARQDPPRRVARTGACRACSATAAAPSVDS